jgi:hypothetical protein
VASVAGFTYGYDATNNRDSLTQVRTAVAVQSPLAYGYDDLDRLTQATNQQVAGPHETFVYDPESNRRLQAALREVMA